jgi:hypothetical protein
MGNNCVRRGDGCRRNFYYIQKEIIAGRTFSRLSADICLHTQMLLNGGFFKMALNRRDFIRLLFGSGLLAASAYLFKGVFLPSQLSQKEARTIEAVLDTLIPEYNGPGALALGVGDKVKMKAASDYKYRRLLKMGCTWLDKAAERLGPGFASLKEDGRDAVLTIAYESTPNSLQRIFFDRMRADAFYYYYSEPASWKQIGYNGPPQPAGFPDYDKPPSARS